MTKKENKQLNETKTNEKIHNQEVENELNSNEKATKLETEKTIEEVSEQTTEQTFQEEKTPESQEEKAEKWLNDILDHNIKVFEKDESGEEHYSIKKVREIIDPEKDIWYSKKKSKPILKETGTRKLIKSTGATFPKITPIERQPDAPTKDREQVWIEATVLFPNGDTHEEYGIANRMNCTDSISQANLPIMARKRAMNRAFLRSDYIGLYDILDENEVLDVRGDEKNEQTKKLMEKNAQLDAKYKKLINQLCKEIKTDSGELVWSINDPEKLVSLSKGSSIVAYVAILKLRQSNNPKKQAN